MLPSTQTAGPGLALFLVVGCGLSHAPIAADDGGPRVRRISGWLVYVVAETEGDGFGLGMDPNLSIDGEDRFHLTHVHQDRGEVLYSHGVLGDFETERVGRADGDAADVRAASHALDPDGTLHVVYGGDPDLGSTHAVRSVDGTYTHRALAFEPGPPDSRHPSVARLSDGTLVFVGAGPLSSSSPNRREIHAIEGSGEPVRIASAQEWRGLNIHTTVTSEGFAHVLVRHLGGMFLATRAPSGSWTVRPLDPPATSAALAPTAEGALHAVFVRADGDERSLHHGRGPSDGSAFEEERIATVSFASSPSIAVGPGGEVHVVWDAAGVVYYASNRTGTWQDEQLEVVSSQNGRPVIALDSRGTPWVAYRNGVSALVLATPDDAPP